jgi:hypothetical protein
MAEKLVHTENCIESVIKKESTNKDVSCDKCLELEHQLQEALQELGSAHLIFEFFIKENALHVTLEHEATKPTSSSQVSPEWDVHGNW